MSSSKGANSTTTTQGPPTWAQPYIAGSMQAASNLYGSSAGPSYYPGNTVAPFSPLQEQAFGQVQDTAQTNPYNQSAGNYFNTLESGALLDPTQNPALQGMVQNGFNQIQNQIGSEFASNGRNPAASYAAQADAMGNYANKVYGTQYANTLDQMTGALGQANNLTAGQYLPSQMLLGAGNQIQTQAQNIIGANQNAYNYDQNLPYQQLSNYTSLVNGIPIGRQTTQPLYNNTAGNIAGLASLGAGIYGNLNKAQTNGYNNSSNVTADNALLGAAQAFFL